jgi:hypothetical protein
LLKMIVTLVFAKNAKFFRRKLAKNAENCDQFDPTLSRHDRKKVFLRWTFNHASLLWKSNRIVVNTCTYVLLCIFFLEPILRLLNLQLHRQCCCM